MACKQVQIKEATEKSTGSRLLTANWKIQAQVATIRMQARETKYDGTQRNPIYQLRNCETSGSQLTILSQSLNKQHRQELYS